MSVRSLQPEDILAQIRTHHLRARLESSAIGPVLKEQKAVALY